LLLPGIEPFKFKTNPLVTGVFALAGGAAKKPGKQEALKLE
jgi:hypothetical protein